MKRVAILLVLAVGLVGVAALLLSMAGDDPARDRREASIGRDARSSGEGSGEPKLAADSDGAPGDVAVDDDPNRIDGPAVTVRGIVLLDGTPVPHATVQLMRATPGDQSLQLSWADPRRRRLAPAPITEGKTDEDGRFTLSGARRTKLHVRAYGENTGVGSARLVIPKEGDPAEVIVRVGHAHEIVGVVVNEKNEPVGGVKLTCSTSDWRSYAFLQEGETAEDGTFGFGGLRRGSHTLFIEHEGYPNLQRSFSVPQAREVRVELVIGGTIEGVLHDDKGAPIVGAHVLVSTGDSARGTSGTADTVTDEAGVFRFPLVAPGTVKAAVIEHDDWGRRESSRSDVILPRGAVKAGATLKWDIELARGVGVRGVVVEKSTGAPVPNARIKLMRNAPGTRNYQASRYTTTNAEGKFAVNHLLEGSYALDVRGKWHIRAISQWMQPNQKMVTDFLIDGVNSPEDVRVEVGGSGRVEGHIAGSENESFKNTWIQVPELQNAINTQADDTGFYVFENLPAGETIKLKSWQPVAESEPFTLETGETKTVDLESSGPPQFTGTIVGSNGDPVAGAYVKAAAASQATSEFGNMLSSRSWNSATTDAEGKFSIRLQGWQLQQYASQKWMIAAVSYKYPLQIKSDISVPKEGQTVEVRLVLEPGGSISGVVEFEGRGVLPNARVNVSPKYADKAEKLREPRVGRYVYTDLAGHFVVEGIGKGEWSVTTTHPDGKAEVRVATAGDTGVRLTIKPTLSLAGVVIDEDGKPLASVSIAAIIPNGQKEQRRKATTDTSGRFRIAHLDAGDYELEASPQQNQGMYYGGGPQTNGGFKKTRTKPYPAGTESIVVEVEPGNKISGRVLDPMGKPVGGAGVIAMPVTVPKAAMPGRAPGQAQSAPTAFTDGRGRFTLKGVGEGEYELVVIAKGYQATGQNASVGETNVEITVKQGATIEVLLLAPDGTPLGGQWINFQAQDPEVTKRFQSWWQRAGNAWNNIGGWQAMSASTKPDGTVKVSGLFPGAYKISVYTERGVVPNVELHTGSGRTTIQLTEGLSITGRVVDEDGNAPVLTQGQLYISAQAGGQWKTAQADAEGNFVLKGLHAGAVKVHVWAGGGYQPAQADLQAGDTDARIVLKKPAPRPAK